MAKVLNRKLIHQFVSCKYQERDSSKEIVAFINDILRAYNNHNIKLIGSFFTDDATIDTLMTRKSVTKHEYLKLLESRLSSLQTARFDEAVIEMEDIKKARISGYFRYFNFFSVYVRFRSGGEYCTIDLTKENGGWKICSITYDIVSGITKIVNNIRRNLSSSS